MFLTLIGFSSIFHICVFFIISILSNISSGTSFGVLFEIHTKQILNYYCYFKKILIFELLLL